MEQAYINRWFASESWVALWHAHITPAATRAASDAGVGVLIVTRRTVYPIRPPAPPPRADIGAELRDALEAQGRRIRDVLGEVRRRGRPALA